MKKLFIILFMTTSITVTNAQSIYDFKVKSIDGKEINFEEFKGKKILIVNTASECGNTPQYEGLQKLYEQQKGELIIVGFPANNFGSQEPGSNSDIKAFCTKNYGVSFPMAAKISVKGNDIDPFYKWLTNLNNPDYTGDVSWNFEKFLFDEKGNLIHRYKPRIQPEAIANDLK